VLAVGARGCMIEVGPGEAPPGALLMFRMRERAIAKHVGILSDSNTLIHARERLGVIEEPFTRAWRRRLAFAFLYPQPRRR
jgi:cell wall-associated NlpC family hydrolase